MRASALNRLTDLPSNSACVSLHLNERIMAQVYYAARKMTSERGQGRGLCRLTFDVTGRRRPKAGTNLQAQLAGGPVDGGVGHHCVL